MKHRLKTTKYTSEKTKIEINKAKMLSAVASSIVAGGGGNGECEFIAMRSCSSSSSSPTPIDLNATSTNTSSSSSSSYSPPASPTLVSTLALTTNVSMLAVINSSLPQCTRRYFFLSIFCF